MASYNVLLPISCTSLSLHSSNLYLASHKMLGFMTTAAVKSLVAFKLAPAGSNIKKYISLLQSQQRPFDRLKACFFWLFYSNLLCVRKKEKIKGPNMFARFCLVCLCILEGHYTWI